MINRLKLLEIYRQLTTAQREQLYKFALHLLEKPNTEGELYTIDQAAKLLCISPWQLRKLARLEKIKAVKFNNAWHISAKDIDEYIKGGGE